MAISASTVGRGHGLPGTAIRSHPCARIPRREGSADMANTSDEVRSGISGRRVDPDRWFEVVVCEQHMHRRCGEIAPPRGVRASHLRTGRRCVVQSIATCSGRAFVREDGSGGAEATGPWYGLQPRPGVSGTGQRADRSRMAGAACSRPSRCSA
jgi:hypothetical protein